MRNTTLLTVICCAAALPAGWMAGRQGKAALASVSVASSAETRSTPALESSRNHRPSPDADTEAAAIAAMPGTERARAALEFSLRRGAGGLAALLHVARHDPTMIEFLVSVWRERDPYTLLQVLGNTDRLLLTNRLGVPFIELMEKLARRDIDGALKSANAIDDPNMRRHTIGRMISTYFQEDAHKALELALAHPDILIDSTMNYDEVKLTPEMIPKLAALPSSMTQTDLLVTALYQLPEEEAWSETEKLNGIVRRRAQRDLAKAWAKKNLPEVMERAREATRPAATRVALHQAVIEELTKTDPSAAADWAEQYMSGSYKNTALGKIADALRNTEPAKAAELREKLPEAYKP